MAFIKLKNTSLYYESNGEGKETIVFGHSMLFNLRMFDDQVSFLSTNYRCKCFDFRGQGKSQITEGGYDLDTLTDDIVELIDKLDCKPCHFVGFSMGGMVAMRLAIKHPELLKSLVLIDTSSDIEPKEKTGQNKLMLLISRYLGLSLLANRIMSMFFSANFINDKSRKELKRIWKNHLLANDKVGITKVIKGVIYRKPVTEFLGEITIPTLILVGENDILTKYDKAEILHENIKNSILKVIPRAGHMSPVEEPEIVNKLISNFLRNIQT